MENEIRQVYIENYSTGNKDFALMPKADAEKLSEMYEENEDFDINIYPVTHSYVHDLDEVLGFGVFE